MSDGLAVFDEYRDDLSSPACFSKLSTKQTEGFALKKIACPKVTCFITSLTYAIPIIQ